MAGERSRSVFEKERQRYSRTFSFSIQRELDGADKTEATDRPVGTTLTLRGLTDKYRSAWPVDPQMLAERMIAHFLIRFRFAKRSGVAASAVPSSHFP